ncbi:hypothetical protein VTH06DRAFT_3818 [Thermothelomyces fergusii]
MDDGYDGMRVYSCLLWFSFLYTYLAKRVPEAAPPATTGTEEWRTWVPTEDVVIGARRSTRFKRGSCASVKRPWAVSMAM